jgi:non-specific serine/threonine protein kinase
MFQKLGALGGIAECLEGLAAVAADVGECELAAQLFGSAAALRESVGHRLAPGGVRERERELDALRAALSPKRFEAAWQIGRELSVSEAISAALTTDSRQPNTPVAAPNPREAAPLTPRELEVANLIACGRSNREIAEELVIAVSTVERHVTNILGKLDLASRTEFATWMLQHGGRNPTSTPEYLIGPSH